MTPRRELLPALTPLRFPAALAVFFAHATMIFPGTSDWSKFSPTLIHASVGVTLFFMLSGFILTYNYLDEFRSPTRRGVWNFYVARWARTYPVHLLAMVAMLPASYLPLRQNLYGPSWKLVLTHVFLGHAFLPENDMPGNAMNPPSWSLSAEWVFYLVLPVLIPGLATGTLRRRALVLLLCLTPWLLALAALAGLPAPTPISPYRYPPVRMVDFVCGVLLGVLWHRRLAGRAPATVSIARATLAEIAAFLVLAASLWALVCTMPDWQSAGAARWAGPYLPPCALLIWVLARNGGLVSRVLVSRPLAYLGEISYAFYMLHWAVMFIVFSRGPRVGFQTLPLVVQWLAALALTLGAAAACYHLFEIPLRDRLRRLLSIRRPAPVPAAEPATVPAEVPARRAA